MTEVTGVIEPRATPEPVSSSRLIVEIGPGRNPFPAVGTRKMYEGEVYIGIESRKDHIVHEKKALEDPIKAARDILAVVYERSGGRYEVREGNGVNTGFESGSADEVYLGNVFSAMLRPTTDDIEATSLVREAARILKPGGVITIVENIVPANRDRLAQLLSEEGLTQTNSGRERDEILVSRYSDRDLRAPDSYVLEYSKVPASIPQAA